MLSAALLMPGAGLALNLNFPGQATVAGGRQDPLTSTLVPTGPWAAGALPARRVEGALDQTAWQIDAPGLTTLQLLAPLRDQLRAAGFLVLWECDTVNCGGFDFRYAIDVMPEPDMHVDLGDFRYLAAERARPEGPETVALLVSRSARMGYVQVTFVGAVTPGAEPALVPRAAAPPAAPAATDIATALEQTGSIALADLTFATGSPSLGTGEFASLPALAAYLADHPDRKVLLVGHTDASGDLAGNVALSKARAASVRDRLIRDHGAPPDRMAAEGAGSLAPRASNLTEAGRTQNRRVEVVLAQVR